MVRGQTMCNPWTTTFVVGGLANNPTPIKFYWYETSREYGEEPWRRQRFNKDEG
jgi:hypothetical protein